MKFREPAIFGDLRKVIEKVQTAKLKNEIVNANIKREVKLKIVGKTNIGILNLGGISHLMIYIISRKRPANTMVFIILIIMKDDM